MSNDKEIYKLSIKNNLKSFLLIIGFTLALVGFNIYAFKYYSYYNFNTFLLSVLAFIPWVAPSFFVHIEYLILNWDSILEVEKKNKRLRYRDKETKIEVGFDDITRITKHQVKDTALLYGFYEYYEIYLKSGEKLIITNLMAREFFIPEIKMEIVERYFPSLWWYNNVTSK